ncbi:MULTISPECIES: DUF3168 domain-containing protein [Rhodopseudomonas]|uniref:DUF3168 domain-containing protein n=1 Tax=Rhodopseudomonas palustris TaxID=1076 RepID=A0A0D7EQZ2_RHOPL|nr:MULTISPECIES: DUF3168 domain-containing protein [Rhodopseudomonas]KIZ43101.1 hypothetical protein OO17_11895 [Rhodopseudomonas palustris]MDF3810686.1 DUF3168 domain-containing protein [Rhodopseudomonas sp. BAL398]WOK18477.1 DUF3168 domain-containing protein [Rhodopseudomonas sp. BAL398]
MTAFEPSLELQKAIYDRLLASADLMALVSVDAVLDANGRPELMPCVNIGEGQTVYRRFNSTSHATLHVWVQESGLTASKQIVGAIVDALRVDAQIDGVLHLEHFTCHDLGVTQTRFMRDPHGSYSHGIVTLAGIMEPN